VRWRLPKVHFMVYEYFFKVVVGEYTWKQHVAENKRFGTTILEAFMYATLSHNYMAWLYDYKHKNPASTLKWNTTLRRKGVMMKKEPMTMMMSKSTVLIWMR
jgi:hypothetical protein